MTATDETSERRASPGLPVLVAAVVSGVAGYVVLVLTARVLSPGDNADFLVFWGALFGVFGVLIGLGSETTRAVFAAAHTSPSSRTATGVGAAALPAGLALGAVVLAVLGLSGALWGPRLFGERWPDLLLALLLGVALFTVHCALAGAAAGLGQWSSYATLVSVEASTRLLLSVLAVALGAGVVGLSWAVAAACGAWLVLSIGSSRYREA